MGFLDDFLDVNENKNSDIFDKIETLSDKELEKLLNDENLSYHEKLLIKEWRRRKKPKFPHHKIWFSLSNLN